MFVNNLTYSLIPPPFHTIAEHIRSPNPNLPPLLGGQEHHQDTLEAHRLDIEGPQRLGDTYALNLIDDPMHDTHVETRLGQGHDT